ncbi:MAG: thymidine phosphorylase [Deltaproteobacteria bacterium]|nr:thymidine phosphorylase [Deltaproteobacteria bacterium]
MHTNVPDLIRRKRDGHTLEPREISDLIRMYSDGAVPDYQMSALLMAVFFRGFEADELAAWTDAMLHSGEVLDFTELSGVKVDKHSTGGVGDKISLCLAPAVAALGVPVPMISGRGLGHTGGTLDKLEAIPGFQIDRSIDEAAALLDKHGLFLIGQTADLAPADRKLYALRDVTGTVESIPLIASSIMSKKLAEGIDGLVLDVKVGCGAFMPDLENARDLTATMIRIGEAAKKKVRALLTNMDCPIGFAVGNALETAEAIDVMKGEGPDDTTDLTVELGAEMLVLGQVAKTTDDGRKMMRQVLGDGRALEKFRAIIEAQGGDPRVCDDPKFLPSASTQVTIPAVKDGFVARIDPRRVAYAAIEVGAGRHVKEDTIDPATGVTLLVRPGDEVEVGEPVAALHHNDAGSDAAAGMLAGAFEISETQPDASELIMERM